MRRVRGARREVDEERLVGHQRLLLADPLDRLVRQVLGEVVALLGRAVGLDRDRVAVQRRRPLIRLRPHEPIEVLEPAAGRRPRVERPHRARLPHRHLMALAELRRRVAVELQRLGQRRGRVRTHRAVAGRRRRDLGDPAHPDRVMVAPGQQRLPRRRAQRRRVEAVVLQPGGSQALRRRRRARTAERARGAEADVVEQHHDDVRRPRRRPQRLDRRKRRIRILGVIRDQPVERPVGDRQHLTTGVSLLGHLAAPRGSPAGEAPSGSAGTGEIVAAPQPPGQCACTTPRLVRAGRAGALALGPLSVRFQLSKPRKLVLKADPGLVTNPRQLRGQ